MRKGQIYNSELKKKKVLYQDPCSISDLMLSNEKKCFTSLFESTDFDFCLCVGSSPN